MKLTNSLSREKLDDIDLVLLSSFNILYIQRLFFGKQCVDKCFYGQEVPLAGVPETKPENPLLSTHQYSVPE